MSSPQPVAVKRKIKLSPYKVPDDNSIFLQSAKQEEDHKKERRKYLALPIEEKSAYAARTMAKLKNELVGELEKEEEGEKEKTPKQIKSKTSLLKKTSSSHELKGAVTVGENITKESKHDLMVMEREKVVLELSLRMKRAEIQRMDKAIAREEKKIKQLERTIERDNQIFEDFLVENERKSLESRRLFEREEKCKQETNAAIKKLTTEIGTIKSELDRMEDILIDYKRYKEFLFRLSPLEWQNTAVKTKAIFENDEPDDQSKGPQGAINGNGLKSAASGSGKDLAALTETHESSANGSKVEKNGKRDADSSEDEPELYFTDPQQLLDIMAELTERNLFLIQSSARMEAALEERRQSTETQRKKIEREEEELTLQVQDLKQKIDKEKARGAQLKQMVRLHKSLCTDDQDVMLDAVSKKISDVHRCCVDDRITNLSTLEKLAQIERHVFTLMESLEKIPREKLEMIRKIKESEKRTRLREEKQREQEEKQFERMKRYLERSLADSKKIYIFMSQACSGTQPLPQTHSDSGKKVMPRSPPISHKVKVCNVDAIPAEDHVHEYLFGSDDVE